MKKNKLVTAIIGGIIFIGANATMVPNINSTIVRAAKVPGINSSYWFKPRTVYIKKKVKIQKIQARKNGRPIKVYKQKPVSTKYLNKGTKVKVETGGASWPWILSGKIPKIGKAESHSYFWIVTPLNTRWISLSKIKTKKNKAVHKHKKTITLNGKLKLYYLENNDLDSNSEFKRFTNEQIINALNFKKGDKVTVYNSVTNSSGNKYYYIGNVKIKAKRYYLYVSQNQVASHSNGIPNEDFK